MFKQKKKKKTTYFKINCITFILSKLIILHLFNNCVTLKKKKKKIPYIISLKLIVFFILVTNINYYKHDFDRKGFRVKRSFRV